MEKTDAAVATVADKLGDKALQYLSSFEELAKQYSPDVVDAGLTVVRLHGAQTVFYGALVTLCIVVVAKIVIGKIKSELEKNDPSEDKIFAMILPSSVLSIIAFVFTGHKIFSFWAWVAIFDPKLYIAYKIFGKLF